MNLSVIINTCALGPDGDRRSSHGFGPKYTSRISLLRDLILPRLRLDPNVDEIIVSGEWEEGEGYTYVRCPGPDHNVWDQCLQKHEATKVAKGDILVYLCDDHVFTPRFSARLKTVWAENLLWDILSPARAFGGGMAATGWNEGYIHAHCIIMRRETPEECSWLDVFDKVRGTWGWDGPATELWANGWGFRIQTDPSLIIHDVEDGAMPR